MRWSLWRAWHEAKPPLTEADIRELQRLVLGGENPDGGRYRNVQVAITNSPHRPPFPNAVPGEMEKLVRWLQAGLQLPIPLAAAVTHAWFVHIHPFADGNGRTARALTNLLFMRSGFPVVVIRRKDRQRYYETLRAADNADIAPLVELLVQRSRDSLRQIDRIRTAAAGINIDLLQVQEAQRRKFEVWQAAQRLLLSHLAEAFGKFETVPGFSVSIQHYDLAEEEDYLAIQRRDTNANCWLTKISIHHAGATRSLLLWMGFASPAISSVAGSEHPIPSVKISEHNPNRYPQWVSPEASFPTSIREMAYHQAAYYCLRGDGSEAKVVREESVSTLASDFASEVMRGWFGS